MTEGAPNGSATDRRRTAAYLRRTQDDRRSKSLENQ